MIRLASQKRGALNTQQTDDSIPLKHYNGINYDSTPLATGTIFQVLLFHFSSISSECSQI